MTVALKQKQNQFQCQQDGKLPSRPLRVSVISRWYHPHVTGVSVVFRRLGPELEAQGVSLTVHTALTEQAGTPVEILDHIKIKRHPVKPVSQGFRIDLELLKVAILDWERSGIMPDVVIVMKCNRCFIPSLLKLKQRGVRIIFFCSIFPEFDKASWFIRAKWSAGTYFMLCLIDATVVHSETFVKFFSAISPRNARFQVMPFPVDCQRFRPAESFWEKSRQRKKLGFDEDGKIILFVGSVIERKGADLLLEAWLLLEQRHPDARLVFAGPYGARETNISAAEKMRHENFMLKFDALLGKLHHRSSVIMVGTVANAEDYYQAADIFAFPSRLEGMGGVIPEAMASQLPCVLTRFEGFPEVEFGEAEQEFLLADFTPTSIASKLEQLLCSDGDRLRLGKRARQQALRVFDIPQLAESFASACRRD
jgi:D-inositol-3-phosphate glycosyltransferase